MEKFNSDEINYIISSGTPHYVDSLCSTNNQLNIFMDLSDDNIDMQLNKSSDIPDYICKVTADIINMLVDLAT